jgi:hypothetical protein
VLLSLSGSTLSLPNSFTLCAGSTSSALSNLRRLGAFTTVGSDPGCICKEGHGPLALVCVKVRHNAVFGQRI